MAKKKAAPAFRCPTNIKANAKKKGLCYSVERVQRDSQKGFITAFHARSSGRAAGFAASPGCNKTMDPFQAKIRKGKSEAERIGQQCALASMKRK